MKPYFLAVSMLISLASVAQSRIFLGVKNRSQYIGEKSKEVWFTGANGLKVRTKFSGTQIEITGFNRSNNSTFLALDPPEPKFVEVAEYDLNGDGRNEIIVAWTSDIGQITYQIFDSKTYKSYGTGTGVDYLRLMQNKLAVVFEHEAGEELNFYTVKGGRVVEAGSN